MMINKNFIQRGVMVFMITIAPLLLFAQDSLHYKKGQEYFKLVEDFFGENPDSVLHYLRLSAEEYKKGKFYQEYIYIINGLSAYYANNNIYKNSIEYAEFALNESEKYLEKDHITYALSLGNHSFSLIYTGNYKKAISNFKDVLAIERIHNDTAHIVGSLKNIADAYNSLGDLDNAINYYNESLAILSGDESYIKQSWYADIYKKRGNTYFKKKDYESSLRDYINANKVLPKNFNKKNYLAYDSAIEINYEIAKIYLEYNDLDSLTIFVNKAFSLCTGEYQKLKFNGYQLLGKYYLKNTNYIVALENLNKANRLIRNTYLNFNKHRSFSDIDYFLGEAYLGNKEPHKAIFHFKRSIHNLKYADESSDSLLVPNTNGIYNPNVAIEAYVGLGKTYNYLYHQKNQLEYLNSSFESYENATTLISEVRNSFQVESSLLRYSEVALPIYEKSIFLALELYKKTKDQSYLSKAFQYNEKSKAILLLESINKNAAIQLGNIPDTLLQKEKDLKLQISSINKKLYDLQNELEKTDTFKIEKNKRQLFSDTEEYDELIRIFEKDYPQYYNLKYNSASLDITDIQNSLKGSQTQLIEYFFGEENTYVFSISKNQVDIATVPNDKNLINDLQIVKDYVSVPPSGIDLQNNLSKYIKSSKNVYERYIKNSIFSDSKHLVFIADGILGYIPFEALIIKDPISDEVSFSLEDQSYLIEEYDVSYSYSSTLFLNSLKPSSKNAQQTFFGVAPSFGQLNDKGKQRVCNENVLYSLQCSEDEVLQIKDLLGGKVLVGDKATLSNTQEVISNSKIIHLATHACLDDRNPEFNKIYLADDYLSNNDLYNLKLNSELAVLSACETGSGRLAKGEGVMSLARGFIHAGCPSIIMSLWSIDDCATSKIMVNFYKELSNEKPKNEALRNAKIQYIQESKRVNQHPYYWAAFVQIGNYNPIKISSSKKYYLLLLIFAATIAFYFIRRKK